MLYLDFYKKILPKDGAFAGLATRGFGYSFSNVKTREKENENLPYFVVSSVNDDYNANQMLDPRQNQSDKAVLLDFFCINLRENCNSKVESDKRTLSPKDSKIFVFQTVLIFLFLIDNVIEDL